MAKIAGFEKKKKKKKEIKGIADKEIRRRIVEQRALVYAAPKRGQKYEAE